MCICTKAPWIFDLFFFSVFFFSAECGAATFTFKNQCGYTVWPGILSNAGSPLLGNGGFKLESGQSASLEAPEGWSGRVWGRTGCSFAIAGTSGGVCVTGDCAGRLQCSGAGAETPATLAEFTLASGGAGNDFYDVSLVDGFNLPLSIVPLNSTCKPASCNASIDSVCPAELRVLSPDNTGAVVGCKSACLAFGTPRYCCSGDYATPSACKPTSYSRFFKAACPSAYSYAYDDPSSLYTCSASTYTITFCPNSSSSTTRYLLLYLKL